MTSTCDAVTETAGGAARRMMDCAKYHARIPVATCLARRGKAVAAGAAAGWGKHGHCIDLGCLRCDQGAAVAAANGGKPSPARGRRGKACKACGRMLPADEFYLSIGNKDNRDSVCKACRGERNTEYRERRRRTSDMGDAKRERERERASGWGGAAPSDPEISIERRDAGTVVMTVSVSALDLIDIVVRPRKQPREEKP